MQGSLSVIYPKYGFLLSFIIPLILAIAGFIILGGITWKEFLLQVGAQVLVAGLSAAAIYASNTYDTEIWNGIVTDKKQVRVSCSHSYSYRRENRRGEG